MRVAAYCRVSTEREDQKNSLEHQKEYFQEYILNRKNWELDAVYYDEGISGTQTLNRRGFLRMMEEAQKGRFELILTKEVSRFARNTVDALGFTRKLKEMGIGVLFTMDHIDTREKDGELRLTIMAGLAQEESRKISERVTWGQRRSMEQGVVFGRDLLGYTVQRGRLYPVEKEAETVKKIFYKYAVEKKGTARIARELQEEGISPKIAESWSAGTVRKILRNEKYAGDLCQGKTRTVNYLTHERRTVQEEGQRICLSDHHPGIISRSLWEQAQEEQKKRHKAGERYSSRYWCSGKIFCGTCKRKYVSRKKNYKSGESCHAFRCSSQLAGNRSCKNPSVNEKVLKETAAYLLRRIPIPKERLIREMLKELETAAFSMDFEEQEKQIERKINHLRRKKRTAVDFALEHLMEKEELRQQCTQYDEEIRFLERQKKELEKSKGDNTVFNFRKILEEILRFETDAEAVYGEIIKRITVYPEQVIQMEFWGLPPGTVKAGLKRKNGKTEVRIREAEFTFEEKFAIVKENSE